MLFTYSKIEKLKSKKTIDLLFTEANRFQKYPLRLVFIETPEIDTSLKMGVSVSKNILKKQLIAIIINGFKRMLSKNKYILIDSIGDKKYSFMFFYQTKDDLTYENINQKTIELFNKFKESIKYENNSN